MPPGTDWSEFVAGASRLVPLLLVSNARALARAGKYSDAESTLSQLGPEDRASSGALDLLARIRAQQGRLREAEDLWTQLSTRDAGNEEYRAALRRIATLQRRPAWLSFAAVVTAGLILIACTALALLKLKNYVSDLRATLQSEVIRASGSRSPRFPESTPPAWSPPEIRVPGVRIEPQGEHAVARFDAGLFRRGVTLRPKGKKELTQLGRRLEPYIGSISIALVGCTDNVPMPRDARYRDNVALGMARANVAFQDLISTTALPVTLFSLRSASGAPCPAAESGRTFRSRTVAIELMRSTRP